MRDFTVTIKVKRCTGGEWVTVMVEEATGTNGSFHGSFPVGEPSKCFVRAIYKGAVSKRAFFRVVK